MLKIFHDPYKILWPHPTYLMYGPLVSLTDLGLI